MDEQEIKVIQDLYFAALEILTDFGRYGEVLQHGDNGEYGTESPIGQLKSAIHDFQYSNLFKEIYKEKS